MTVSVTAYLRVHALMVYRWARTGKLPSRYCVGVHYRHPRCWRRPFWRATAIVSNAVGLLACLLRLPATGSRTVGSAV